MSGNAEDVTYMPAEQFDELARTLDEPDGVGTWMLPPPARAELAKTMHKIINEREE